MSRRRTTESASKGCHSKNLEIHTDPHCTLVCIQSGCYTRGGYSYFPGVCGIASAREQEMGQHCL